MQKSYVMVVRDNIAIGRFSTDEDLQRLECYYRSPVFSWDGTFSSLDAIINRYQKNFNQFLDWQIEVMPV